MDTENNYRPQVINNAPIQGYGLNRNRGSDMGAYAQRENEIEMKGALERYEQVKRDHYRGLNKEEILPFLPTAKQIIENQAVRDVKGEMIQMRGHILSSFQKMRADVENIQNDVAKSNTRFKYAQSEYQDSLKREMAARDNQTMDILEHIKQWNPNQITHPLDQQYSQKTLAKVPDFAIPQLNFEAVTAEFKARLENLKNPEVFKTTAAQKLQAYSNGMQYAGVQPPQIMIRPNDYIRPVQNAETFSMANPRSKYLDQVMEEERNRFLAEQKIVAERERAAKQKFSNVNVFNDSHRLDDSGKSVQLARVEEDEDNPSRGSKKNELAANSQSVKSVKSTKSNKSPKKGEEFDFESKVDDGENNEDADSEMSKPMGLSKHSSSPKPNEPEDEGAFEEEMIAEEENENQEDSEEVEAKKRDKFLQDQDF